MMFLKEIESYFIDTGKLLQILVDSQEIFNRIVFFQNALRAGAIDHPNDVDKALKELVALYSHLNVVARIADNWLVLAEEGYFNARKIEADKNKEKYSIAALEKEAEVHAFDFLRVKNIFEAYRDSCDRIISVLQSSLKSLDKEKFYHKQG